YLALGGATGEEHDRGAELGVHYEIGPARHPSSRPDDQHRRRAGRQGDPGGLLYFASLNDELVLSNAPEVPHGIASDEETGEINAEGAHRHIDHAQRVAEGTDLEIHRNTWRYTRLIEQQRAQLLTYRESVLHTDLADE